MKKIVNYCLYVLAASYCTAPLHGQTVTETIDELLKAYSAQGEFNGCALVAKNGTVMLNKGYGFRNLLAKTPHDAHSIFQISSLTQEFTTAIILQMQEKKLLSVRDPIAAYLPGFPHGNEISIEDLLTHTSGIFNYTDNPEFIKSGWVKPIRTDSLAVFFRGRPLEFQPGTSYRYSNSGYVLLGYIIEKISG
ncbi:MAG TPA: serine hydrolase domain-containing protein, partial [Puia sp.]|nr:serine hydrolase domain-containing protein [Puia sp.]